MITLAAICANERGNSPVSLEKQEATGHAEAAAPAFRHVGVMRLEIVWISGLS
jgi:hypothetical protein